MIFPLVLTAVGLGILVTGYQVLKDKIKLPFINEVKGTKPVPEDSNANNDAFVGKSVVTASDLPPVSSWPLVTLPNGEQWRVAPFGLHPMGIQRAFKLAQENGWQLPTKALVDATYEAADVWVKPTQPNTFKKNESGAIIGGMNTPETLAAHAAQVEKEIDGRAFRLLAGSHKDIVRDKHPSSGILVNGIYGWKNPTTKKSIQDFPSIHINARGEGDEEDYSQWLRPGVLV